MSVRVRHVCVAGGAMALLAACGVAPSATPAGRAAPVLQAQAHPPLDEAIRAGRFTGPLDPATPMHIELGLAARHTAQLEAILAQGGRVSAAQYATRFGPAAGAVQPVRRALLRDGVQTTWSSGDTAMAAQGTAAAVERALQVRIGTYVGPDGTAFFAPEGRVAIPARLRGVVTAVGGLDDYPSARLPAIRSAYGVTPDDAISFYDIAPLRSAGIDGTGQTVVLPEDDAFSQQSLDAYARKFSLPPFNVQVVRNPAWGSPSPEEGEADLDVELVHAMAPGAKEIVYYGSNPQGVEAAEMAALQQHPTAIVTWSIDLCEALDGGHQQSNLLGAAQQRAAAQGTTIYVASSDKGAYDCVFAGGRLPDQLSVNLFASFPDVTAVGGTLVEESTTGGYGQEAAWGEPLEQWGSGGGLSTTWRRPAWQTGLGVSNQYSNGMRQVPDVASLGDGISGWDIFIMGQDSPVGGTSSGAPFWAGITALMDEDLQQRHLPALGFADPVFYKLAQLPGGIPAPPFHDITVGTNLYYLAEPGWDYTTGLGTPDVAALTDDLEWYEQQQQTKH